MKSQSQPLLKIKIPPRPTKPVSGGSGLSLSIQGNQPEAHAVKLNELEEVRFWVDGSCVVFEKSTNGLIAPPVKVSIHDIVSFSTGQKTFFP